MSSDYGQLCRKVGYDFQDRGLLEQALTHRSADKLNNERLEFLGDAALNFVIAAELWTRFPKISEGQLSRLRASLVNGATLAELARQLELGNHLVLGTGELKSGGFRRESILAGALEAVLGALYLDAGFDKCYEIISQLFAERLAEVSPGEGLKDPKTRLQEVLQGQGLAVPAYRVTAVEGEAHDRVFHVECSIEGLGEVTTGQGSSRRRAEQEAASRALELLR